MWLGGGGEEGNWGQEKYPDPKPRSNYFPHITDHKLKISVTNIEQIWTGRTYLPARSPRSIFLSSHNIYILLSTIWTKRLGSAKSKHNFKKTKPTRTQNRSKGKDMSHLRQHQQRNNQQKTTTEQIKTSQEQEQDKFLIMDVTAEQWIYSHPQEKIEGIALLTDASTNILIHIQFQNPEEMMPTYEIELELHPGMNYLGWLAGQFTFGQPEHRLTPNIYIPGQNGIQVKYFHTHNDDEGYQSTSSPRKYALPETLQYTTGVTLVQQNTPTSLFTQLRIWHDSDYYNHFLTRYKLLPKSIALHKQYLAWNSSAWWGNRTPPQHAYWEDKGYGHAGKFIYPADNYPQIKAKYSKYIVK